MKIKSYFPLLFLILSVSCASSRLLIENTSSPSTSPSAVVSKTSSSIPTAILTPQAPPPVLTEAQIFGFVRPPGMLKDHSSGHYALPAVIHAFWKFKKFAKTQGWNLILVSGYRSYWNQLSLWNHSDDRYLRLGATDQKKRVEAILNYVFVPGLSRHHWGTELDISEATLRGQLVNVQPDTPEKVLRFYAWMKKNAPAFGFCKVYMGTQGAVHNEPWHWSYLPYSRVYEKQFNQIKNFKRIFNINEEDVHYLMKHFDQILKSEKQSVNPSCGK